MVAKKKKNKELKGKELVKEVCRRIRVARSYWDARKLAACRGEREKALVLYETLTPEQKEQIHYSAKSLVTLSSARNILVKTNNHGMATKRFLHKKKRK